MTAGPTPAPAAAQVIEDWFAAQPELEVERVAEGEWLTVLSGTNKKTVPVYLQLGEHTLTVQSFFIRAPDERLDEVYAFLLRRNLRSYLFRFALSDDGDILLVGVLPVHALTAEELDRALGQLLAVADDAFAPALRLGFASYIEREQAWRASVGAPPNPVT